MAFLKVLSAWLPCKLSAYEMAHVEFSLDCLLPRHAHLHGSLASGCFCDLLSHAHWLSAVVGFFFQKNASVEHTQQRRQYCAASEIDSA
jgi:hypothetical protein